MRDFVIRVSIVVLAIAVALPVMAQQRTGIVDGVVVDEGGVALPGVTVVLSGDNIMGDRSTVTSTDGEFRIVLVPPGVYSVRANLSGYQTVEQTEIQVMVGQSSHLAITLDSGFEDTIEVVADQVLIDTTSSAVGTNITGEFIGRLANDRQYQMAMEILPGAVEGNNPQIHGAASSDNMYSVDGADSTDPLTRTWSSALNFDNIQDIQIVTGGVSAEYGRGTGALVNLVTKSGSNEFHGTLRYTMARLDWNEELKGDRYYFDAATKHVDEDRPAANLGGPIVRDKLWFFVSYEGRDKSKFMTRYENWEDALAGTYTDGTATYKGRYASGKLTWQPTPSHSFFVNYMEDPIDFYPNWAYRGYTYYAESSDATQEQGGDALIADWTGVMSDSVFLTAKYNYKRAPLNQICSDGSTHYYTWAGGGYHFGGCYREYLSYRDHDIYSGTGTKFIDTAGGGHEIKAGLEYRDVAIGSFSEYYYPSNEYIRMDGGLDEPELYYDKYVYTDEGRRGWNDTTQTSWAFFVQDSWRVNANLTLNLGLRVEQLQDKTNTGEAILDWGIGDRLSPRLGFAYEINGNNLHGSIGRYHDTIGTYTTTSFNNIPDYIRDHYYWNADIMDWEYHTTYVTSASTGTTREDPLKSPYMDEFTVGYMGRLSQTMAFGVDLIYRVWKDGIEDDDATDFPDNPAGDYNYHFLNLDKQKEYQGIEFTLRKNLAADNLQFLASYTYSRTEGVWGDSQESTGYADNPFNYYNWYGYRNDWPHMVKFNGSYFAPWGFVFGANLAWYAGPSYNRTATVVTSADGEWGGDTFGGYYPYKAGSANLPNQWTMDLRVEKEFKLSSRFVFGLYVDVFNVFNNQEPVDIDGNIGRVTLVNDEPGAAFTVTSPNSYYLTYTEWQAPRSYFLGVKLDF